MELSVLSGGKPASKITVSEQLFGRAFNEPLIHQVVNAYLAGARQGTKAQKNRSDCRGGGAKPWRQKGTGRARAGTSRSPLWRSGGVTFAARPRSYDQKVNRKAYRAAMSSIVSELIRQERLLVVKEMTVSAAKTKELVEQLKSLPTGSLLLVTAEQDVNLELAARNLPKVAVSIAADVNPVELIAMDYIVVTADALNKLEEKLS